MPNRRLPVIRKVWLLIAAAMVAGVAWALDPPRPAPSPPAAEPATSEQPTSVPAPVAAPAPAAREAAEPQADEKAVPAPPAEARRTGPTPQRFDPTEEVRADFPVSFPSDI
jgi:hypothetical protein